MNPNTPPNGTITFGYTDGTEERTTVPPDRIEDDGRYYLITMKNRLGESAWPPRMLSTGIANRKDVIDFLVLTYEGETFSGTAFDVGPSSLELRKIVI